MTLSETNLNTKSGRVKAFLIHLLLSVCIGVSVGVLFWFVLYPAPLFRAVGGLEIFLIVLAVDVTLGPFLTLLVYRKGKKGLVFDLAAIALVQAAALTYGIVTLYVGRPVFVAALGHRFDVIQASEVNADDIRASGRSLPRFGPIWVGIRRPDSAKERSDMQFSSLAGADYGHKPQYHVDLAEMRSELLREAKPIADLRTRDATRDGEIGAWLAVRGRTDDSVRYVGLKARVEDMAVILDAKTAEVIGIAPFKPWD